VSAVERSSRRLNERVSSGPHPLRSRLSGPVEDAARALLGAHLVRENSSGLRLGRIVEVEAYDGPADRASHARFGGPGRTTRNAVMFGPAGVAYVYLVYGMYDCLNVVSGTEGEASACLIRAVEPLSGIESMRAARAAHERSRRRSRADDSRVVEERVGRLPVERLASGPGLVAAAFSIDRSLNGLDLLEPTSPLRLEPAPDSPEPGEDASREIRTSRRLGIDYARPPWTELPWRFFLADSPAVSGPRGKR
jgi:DNA-3-methyladenine glycosylase